MCGASPPRGFLFCGPRHVVAHLERRRDFLLGYLRVPVCPLRAIERRRVSRSSTAFLFFPASRAQTAWPARPLALWLRCESVVRSHGPGPARAPIFWSL